MRQKERSACSKVFSAIDITGPEISHFSFNRQSKYKTGWGGFASLLCILAIGGYSGFLMYRYIRTPYFTMDSVSPPVTEKLRAVLPVVWLGTGEGDDTKSHRTDARRDQTFPGFVLEAPSSLKYTIEETYNVTLSVQ